MIVGHNRSSQETRLAGNAPKKLATPTDLGQNAVSSVADALNSPLADSYARPRISTGTSRVRTSATIT